MPSRPRGGPDVDQERNERRRSQDRDVLTCWVGWWACQDLNLGPHPYQAYSRDAFKLGAGETVSSWRRESDRGCPLDTGLVRLMWHGGGTARRTWLAPDGDGSTVDCLVSTSSVTTGSVDKAGGPRQSRVERLQIWSPQLSYRT